MLLSAAIVFLAVAVLIQTARLEDRTGELETARQVNRNLMRRVEEREADRHPAE